jgi:hypothetical protein
LYTKKHYNLTMRVQLLIRLILISLIITACSVQPTQPTHSETATIQETSGPLEVSPTIAEISNTACPGDEVNPLGQSIAEDYDFITYDQVMAWFCEGAAFEDIMVALETEAVTDTPAGEMLQMLADGFTWDEIWQLVGLDE